MEKIKLRKIIQFGRNSWQYMIYRLIFKIMILFQHFIANNTFSKTFIFHNLTTN